MSLPSLSRGARDSMGSFPRCFPAVFPARASLSYFYAASFAIAPGAGAVAGSVGSATQQVSPNDPAELWAARSGPEIRQTRWQWGYTGKHDREIRLEN